VANPDSIVTDMRGAMEAHQQFLVYMVGAIASHERRWAGGPNVANDAIKAECRFVEYLLRSIDAQSKAIFKMIEDSRDQDALVIAALSALSKQEHCDRAKFQADFVDAAAKLYKGADKIPPHTLDVSWVLLGQEPLKEN
jgi:hypothetical protein